MATNQELYNELADEMRSVKSEYETKLDNLQDVAQEITAISPNANLILNEILTIEFTGIDTLLDKVKSIEFLPIQEQQTFDDTLTRTKQRVWQTEGIDQTLNEIENKIISIVSTADEGILYSLNAIMIPDALKSILIQAQDKSDQRDLNTFISLANLFPSNDQTANIDWLQSRHDLKRSDRERNIFAELFKLAQGSMQWANKNQLQIHEMHTNYVNQYNNLTFNLTSANIAIYKAESMANIAEFEARLQEINAEYQYATINLERESAEYELQIKQITARLGEYAKQYSSYLGSNFKNLDARITGNKNVADGFKSIFSAYGGQVMGISSETIGATEE